MATTKHERWKLLRRLTGLGVDPDWSDLQLHPNTGIYTVGGTTSNGVYSITIGGVAVEFDRQGGETDAQIATALAAAATALIATTLAPFVVSATAVGVDVQIRYVDEPANGQTFEVSTSAPGTATLVGVPGTTWPIVARLAAQRTPYPRQPNTIALAFTQVDSNGDVIPDDNVATVFPQVVDVIERDDDQVAVVRSVTIPGHSVRVKLMTEINGSDAFTVRLGSPAVNTEATGYAAIEIWYREMEL